MEPSVLIIDDEEKLRSLLARLLDLEGFHVENAASAKDAIRKLERIKIDVILCDVKLPDVNGIEFIGQLKEKSGSAEIIMLTAYGNIADGVQAMKNGAFDYITKGDDNDKIIPLIHRAWEKVQLKRRVAHLEKRVSEKFSFDKIIGHSAPVQHAIELAKKVASLDTTVLITGETGTGKEVFAQAIHEASGRKHKSFVAVNCSAISKEILESELFGHLAGSFTSAIRDKKGLIEEADEGTMFLDEIGEMPLELQSKLLRVLETGEYIKVGDTKTKTVNVRFIAATNRNLSEEIESGKFRQDLFYRLSVFTINLPPLRDRVSDVPLLAKHFLEVYSFKTNKKISGISAAAMDLLQQFDYPGNIRELKNIIERAVILENNDTLTPNNIAIDHSPHSVQSALDHSKDFSLAAAEKMQIERALLHAQGNKSEAARLLNIGLTTLYRKIEEYELH